MHLKNAFRFFDKFIFPIISRGELLEIMVIVGRKEDDNYGWR